MCTDNWVAGEPDKEVEEVTDMFSNLVKKKKKKSSKSKEGDEDAVADGEDALAGLKKKKKKSSKPKVGPFRASSSVNVLSQYRPTQTTLMQRSLRLLGLRGRLMGRLRPNPSSL
jgi:hypothetical protein